MKILNSIFFKSTLNMLIGFKRYNEIGSENIETKDFSNENSNETS